MKNKHSIIIADDHAMFVDGLKSILAEDDSVDIKLTAANGKQVLKYLRINADENIDLVITDLNMPDMDGLALHRQLKKEFPTVKTLVVSMLENPQKIKTLTDENVNGYISKNSEKRELLRAIKTILEGKTYFSPHIKALFVKATFEVKKEAEINLTTREKEVLKLIAHEHTTQEIADKLYLSKHTIESYRKNLISKLDVRNLAGLTRYAIENDL